MSFDLVHRNCLLVPAKSEEYNLKDYPQRICMVPETDEGKFARN